MAHNLISQNATGPVSFLALWLGIANLPSTPRRYLYLALVLIILLGVGLVSKFGRRGWRYLERRLMGPAILSTERIQDDGTYRNLVFLHHSTGENLIHFGNVRNLLALKGYQFWDHGYNQTGLTRPDGTRTHTHYDIPEARLEAGSGGNTDPEGLAVLFAQPVRNPPDNAYSRLLQHPIVIFKSCFPNSALKSDEMLERHKALYMGMRDSMAQHPEKLFILLTTPPLHPKVTSAAEAKRARSLSQWLQSDVFLGGLANLQVFDFFNLLADPSTNMLRTEYQEKGSDGDSHPNALANKAVGPLFVDFIDRAVRSYTSTLPPALPKENLP